MEYISKRQKIKDYIKRYVIDDLMENPKYVDYNQLVDVTALETNSSKKLVIEIINFFISAKCLAIVDGDCLGLSERLKEVYDKRQER